VVLVWADFGMVAFRNGLLIKVRVSDIGALILGKFSRLFFGGLIMDKVKSDTLSPNLAEPKVVDVQPRVVNAHPRVVNAHLRVVDAQPVSLCDAIPNLINFSVTTDSVVATATVVTSRSSTKIEIDWGDGQTDAQRLTPGLLFEEPLAILEQGDTLPKGTYQFSHVYDVSEDGKPFDNIVQATVDNGDGPIDFRFREITLTPRYKVYHYQAIIWLEDKFDWNSLGNFEIYQNIGAYVSAEVGYEETKKKWTWNPAGDFFGYGLGVRLPDSQIEREMTMEDRGISVSYYIVDRDKWSSDDELIISFGMHPGYGSEPASEVEADNGIWGDEAGIRFQRSAELIVNQPYSGTVFASSE
jgi:hypothetical protein